MAVNADLLRELFGTTQPATPCLALEAGALSVRLEAGNLRYIRFDDIEILRAIAFVVRDCDWGTFAPVIEDLHLRQEPERFAVSYRATCKGARSSLRYDVMIEGSADGHLQVRSTAVADGDFETNRCGFVVLHPADIAGVAATVEHCDGQVWNSAFPELIDPWQPFKSIRAITHIAADRFGVTCRLEGEEYEMEDQRNWSDASFKTYGRPLALPWPFILPDAAPFERAVDVVMRPLERTVKTKRSSKGTPGGRQIDVGQPLGVQFPEIGLLVTPDEVAMSIRHRELLAGIGPQRILCGYDPTTGDGANAFVAFAEMQAAFPSCSFDLECVLACNGALDAELTNLVNAIEAAGLELVSIAVCPAVDRHSTPPGSAWPDCPSLESLYAATRRHFPNLLLGGGMFSYFTELNRKRPPLGELDFVTHSTNPIVHAADDDSVMESLEALPHIMRTTRAIIGTTFPYRIGPSTIAMRLNPYGSRTMDNPDAVRLCMAHDDPRQRGHFAGAWTAGYAAAIAPFGIATWVPASCVGPRGLLETDSGTLLPVAQTVKALAALAGQDVLAVDRHGSTEIATVAVRSDTGAHLIIVNLTPQPIEVDMAGTTYRLTPFEVRSLDTRLDAVAVR